MKTIFDFRLWMMAAICSLCLMSCEKPEPDTPRDERVLLTASTDTVRCIDRMGEQTVLSLAWTAGTNHGTGSAIAYTIDINYADSGFTEDGGMQIAIGKTMDRTLSFTHRQLLDTLPLFFPEMQNDEYYNMILRVRATVVKTGEEQFSDTIAIALMLMSPIPDLYLVGDATPNGWDLAKATAMVNDIETPHQFTWTGKLRKGEFKPVCSRDNWLPCYVRDTLVKDSTGMIYRETEATYPDMKWIIPYTGRYTIDIDTELMTIAITTIEISEIYDHIYMIGDATPGGWSWDAITELDHPETNIFTYEGPLSAGQIKFPTELKSDWSGEMLFAPEPDLTAPTLGTFEAHTGGPDNKWLIPAAGTWSITINIADTTISFVQL